MDAFLEFVERHRAELERYARFTQGEFGFEDVRNTACVIWLERMQRIGVRAALSAESLEREVLRPLRRRLDRDTDWRLRKAADFDSHGEADQGRPCRPLGELIAGDGGAHPLSLLIDAEDAPAEADRRAAAERRQRDYLDHSRVGAWLLLRRRFDDRMRAVARFLSISVSHAYRCHAEAGQLAKWQHAIAFAPIDDAALGPWRRRRHERASRQLDLDFGESLV
jgi:hypothetical protein